MILLNQRHKYGANRRTDSNVEMGSVPNFTIQLDTAPVDGTSSAGSSAGVGTYRVVAKQPVLKTQKVSGKGKGLESSTSVGAIQFAKAGESSWSSEIRR